MTNIGNLYRDQDKLDKAESFYKRAIAISPELIRATLDLGLIYMKDGNTGAAARVLSAGLK